MKAITLLFALLNLTACAEVEAVLNGEVILNPSLVEKGIEDGIYEQSGINVIAECPDPLSAAVGETRTCLVSYSGFNQKVDIIVQNSEGYFIWEVRQ